MHTTGDVYQSQCEHFALVYDGVDDLCRRLAPSLRRAADEGGAVLVCLDDHAAAKVRADFGAVSDSFVFVSATQRYATPGVAMAQLDRFVGDALTSGAPTAWSIGSIPLGGDRADIGWIRYEGAVTTLFADHALRAVCLYDAAATPSAVRDSVHRTHQSVDGEWISAHHEILAALSDDLCPLRAADLTLFDAEPRAVRAAIDVLFADLSSTGSVADLRLVATELVTNALVHGIPPAEVRIWRDGPVWVLQVRDTGTSEIDAYADLRRCTGGAHGGFGMFTVGQLADAVHIARDARGNTVTALFVTR